MKIVLVILHADPLRGGAERYTVDLAGALERRGHDVFLADAGDTGAEYSIIDSKDIPYHQVKLKGGGVTRVGQYHRFIKSLNQFIDDHHFDIVHAMLPVPRCDVYHPHAGIAIQSVLKTGMRLPFNMRRKAFANVERELLTGSNAPVVLCLSDYVKQEVSDHYPMIPQNKLQTLFNAVDLHRFEPESRRKLSTEIRALMIANDFDRKGLAETLHAMAKVRDPRLHLDVYGKEDTRKYAQLAAELKISDLVRFRGITSNPREAYLQADFFILPTRHDPCSLVVLEALSMGLPVISTRFNGACEIMTDGVHGFVLPDPNDVDALAQATKRMLEPPLRARMSAACLELRPRLSYEHHLDQLIQIYQQSVIK